MTWLTSVSEVIVFNEFKKPILQKKLDMEPGILGLGRDYVVAGMNNKCLFIHLSTLSMHIKVNLNQMDTLILKKGILLDIKTNCIKRDYCSCITL